MQPISVLEAGNATLAQLVEQRIRNAQVEGSNPLSGSLTALDLWILGGFCLWSGFPPDPKRTAATFACLHVCVRLYTGLSVYGTMLRLYVRQPGG